MRKQFVRFGAFVTVSALFNCPSVATGAPNTEWLELLARRVETAALRPPSHADGRAALGAALSDGDGQTDVRIETCVDRAAPAGLARLTSAYLTCAQGQRGLAIDEDKQSQIARALVALTRFPRDKYLDKAEVEKLSSETSAAVAPRTESVASQLDGAILTVTLRSIDADVPQKVREAVQARGNSLHALVIDLRGNEGGLLDAAIQTADLFLTEGVIASLRNSRGVPMVYQADKAVIAAGLPITVLVDGGTANGAELIAAALADNNRAKLAGTATMGVGTIRTLFPLSAETFALITTEEFLRPDGSPIDGVGLNPAARKEPPIEETPPLG